MGLIQRITNAITSKLINDLPSTSNSGLLTKASPTVWKLISDSFQRGTGTFPEKSLDKFVDAYGLEVWAYACVTAITSHISQLPPRFYRVRKSGKRDYVTGGAAKDLFEYINENMTFSELVEQTFTYLETTGWSHWEIAKNGINGKVEAIYPLESWRMTPIVEKTGIEGWNYYVNGKWQTFDKSQIFHLQYFNPASETYGLSPIQVIYNPIMRSLYQEKWNINYFKNNAIPPIVLVYPEDDEADEDDIAEVRAKWKENYGGTDNAHEPAVLTGGVDIKLLQQSMKDMDFQSGEKSVQSRILAAFNVPPIYVGIVDSTKYQTSIEQQRIFWTQAITPKRNKFQDKLNSKFMPSVEPGVYIELDMTNVLALQEDLDKKINRYKDGIRYGAITPEEMRIDIFGKEPSGDDRLKKFYMDQSIIPIELVEARAEQKTETDRTEPDDTSEQEEPENDTTEDQTPPAEGNNNNKNNGNKSIDYCIKNLLDSLDGIIYNPAESENNGWKYGGIKHREYMKRFERIAQKTENDLRRFWKQQTDRLIEDAVDQWDKENFDTENFDFNSDLKADIQKKAIEIYEKVYERNFEFAGELIEEELGDLINKKKKQKTLQSTQSAKIYNLQSKTKADDPGFQFEDLFENLEEEKLYKDTVGWRQLSENSRVLAGTDTTKLSESARNKIKQVVHFGIMDGASSARIAKDIITEGVNIKAIDAVRIARTSSTAAYNGASKARYSAINETAGITIVEGERWSAELTDGRTRQTHLEAHNQIVQHNQLFAVGADRLEYPGDPSGSPEETYNCRCAVAPVIDPDEVKEALDLQGKQTGIESQKVTVPRYERNHINKVLDIDKASDVLIEDARKKGIELTKDEAKKQVLAAKYFTKTKPSEMILRHELNVRVPLSVEDLELDSEIHPSWSSISKSLNDFIENSPKFESNTPVYRGISVGVDEENIDFVNKLRSVEIGSEISLETTTHWSSNARRAQAFALESEDDVILRIKNAPERSASIKHVSSFYDEEEVVFGKGIKLKVVSKRKRTLSTLKRLVIDVEEVIE